MYYGLERVLQFQISQTTIVQNFLKTDERGNTRFYGLVLYKVSVNSPYHVENTRKYHQNVELEIHRSHKYISRQVSPFST
jgi:hypothetical protein